MAKARRAVVMFPMSDEAYERLDPKLFRQYVLDRLAGYGTVLPETLEIGVRRRATIDGVTFPWYAEGIRLPDNTVLARASAYVIPNEQQQEILNGRS